jgi:hypothetical protein
MKNILIILSLLISHTALAGDFSSYYSECVLRKNGNFRYSLEQVEEMNREMYTPSGTYNTISHHAVANIIRGGTRVYDEARNVLSLIRRGTFIKGKNIRKWTKDSLKEQVRIHRLNSFEKAALINCAVAQLIDYRDNTSTKLGSLLEIYEKGEGICTEMTDVAIDLGNEIGLRGRSVISDKDHNWPEFNLDGRWYIVDPTSNGSTFYESLKD